MRLHFFSFFFSFLLCPFEGVIGMIDGREGSVPGLWDAWVVAGHGCAGFSVG